MNVLLAGDSDLVERPNGIGYPAGPDRDPSCAQGPRENQKIGEKASGHYRGARARVLASFRIVRRRSPRNDSMSS